MGGACPESPTAWRFPSSRAGDEEPWRVAEADDSTKGDIVIADDRVSAVLCSTDLEKTREFYEDKVGLRLSPETIKNHLVFECGSGTTLLIYGRPSPNLADHTQVRFWSADISADVRELERRGVVFDLVEFGDLKMVDHVLTSPGIGKSAWFKDPDGNTLSVTQF
jgi:catechol 2,3-dioxygenase-like lactoylglutathione lyase family enzyme